MREMINFEDVYTSCGSKKFLKELLDANSIVASKIDQAISINECSNGYNRFIKIDLPGIDTVDVKFFTGNAELKLRSKVEGITLDKLLGVIINEANPNITPTLQVELNAIRGITHADKEPTL